MRLRSSLSAWTRVRPIVVPVARFGPILRCTRVVPAHQDPYQLSLPLPSARTKSRPVP